MVVEQKKDNKEPKKKILCVITICSSYYRINWTTIVINIGCSIKFSVKVGVEESIVNAPFV
jgi:hypothetical protein